MPGVEVSPAALAGHGASVPAQAPAVDTSVKADVAAASLPRVLTLGEARATAAALETALAAMGSGQTLQVDCSDLVELDSASLAVLLQSQRAARARGARVTLHAAPAKLQALAALYGVDGLLGLGPQGAAGP